MRRIDWKTTCACAAMLFIGTASDAAEPSRRVEPPKEWSRDVLDTFFDDAREQLVGDRPVTATVTQGAATPAPGAGAETPSEDKFKWSTLVNGEALTAEVKRLNNQLSGTLKKAATFQGGGNLECRRDFGLLAVLFAVIAQHDQDVRWQRSAQTLEAICKKTSRNCKLASAQTLESARSTLATLEDLVRGQAPAAEDPSGGADEGELVERTLLMQGMELALKDRLSPTLANAREFRKRTQLVAEQAQLLAVLAEVIQREGYEYADDDSYLEESRNLREASVELSRAAQDRNYDAARAAAGKVGQSCSSCHEGFRG